MRSILIFLTMLALVGCASYSPRIDYDRAANFSDLQRFAWVPEQGAEGGYQSLDQARIRRAFSAGLTAKGMTEVAVDEAQVWVDIDYAIDRRYEARSTFYGYYRWHPYWWGMEPDYYLQERDESRLVLLMIDPASRSVIWAGQTVLRYYEEKPPLERDASLREQVERILARFPPS